MIRELNRNDNECLLNYLAKESAFNLFIIGDIENFGYETDFQKLWGEIDLESGLFKAVLLKYYKSFIFYCTEEADFEGFARIIKEYGYEVLSGKKESIDKLEPYFEKFQKRATYFAELTEIQNEHLIESVEKANLTNVDEIIKLGDNIEEFSDIPSNREALIKSLDNGSSRIYFVRREGKIVSMAQTTAENSKSAMIIGVCTHKNYRKQGLVSHCLKKLCADVVDEGKTLCLFYDNPEAGKIYLNMGFKDIGFWTMLIDESPKK